MGVNANLSRAGIRPPSGHLYIFNSPELLQQAFNCMRRRLLVPCRGREVGLMSGSKRSDCINRTAGSDEQRAIVRAAKSEAAGPLGNFQHTDLFSFAAIDVDLVAGDVCVARFVAHNRRAPAFRKKACGQFPILSQLYAIGFPVILAGQKSFIARGEEREIGTLQNRIMKPLIGSQCAFLIRFEWMLSKWHPAEEANRIESKGRVCLPWQRSGSPMAMSAQ